MSITVKHPLWIVSLICTFVLLLGQRAQAEEPAAIRATVVKAILTEDTAEQANLVRGLAGTGGTLASSLLTLWKEGGIYIYGEEAARVPVTLFGDKDDDGAQGALKVLDEKPLLDGDGKALRLKVADLETAETDSQLRRAMKDVTDLAALSDPDAKKRELAVQSVGNAQDLTKVPVLEARLKVETDPKVQRLIREAIAITNLTETDVKKRIAACEELGAMASLSSQDALKRVQAEAEKSGGKELAAAAAAALTKIASHVTTVNTVGTLFRGLSAGSILLVTAIGLAITFGLMGVINMAHGELLVVGAYTTYVIQCIFGKGLALSPFGVSISIPGMNATGSLYDAYFILALPMSFIVAALVGIVLERGIIRFLYSRPLESLLATWGVSLVLQQLFRLIFGANNVQVDSPGWLSGNWILNDIQFTWNRVFVIAFAILIIVLTWAVLNKTPLGLLIRSVMQNRSMAACMGVRTERVNMLTFGFGSGLAGLAGAFLSQLGNVGPSLGQSYIVDTFMTVVVGGVGNLIGTVISALGIGVVDQSLQQILGNPVLGKILVLGAIILFLQWRPSGIFVTRSRSLES